MKDELRRIDREGGIAKGKGTAIALPNGYISGFPYLFTSDFNRAFCFRDTKQAKSFIRKFKSDLTNPQVIQR